MMEDYYTQSRFSSDFKYNILLIIVFISIRFFYLLVFSSSSSLTLLAFFSVFCRNSFPVSRHRSTYVLHFCQSSSSLSTSNNYLFLVVLLFCCFTVSFNLTKRRHLLRFVFIETTKKIEPYLGITENMHACIFKIFCKMSSKCSHYLTASLFSHSILCLQGGPSEALVAVEVLALAVVSGSFQ